MGACSPPTTDRPGLTLPPAPVHPYSFPFTLLSLLSLVLILGFKALAHSHYGIMGCESDMVSNLTHIFGKNSAVVKRLIAKAVNRVIMRSFYLDHIVALCHPPLLVQTLWPTTRHSSQGRS